MISKKDLIQMARHIARRDAGYPDRRIIHPSRDWLIGLALATLLFFISIVYAGYLFFSTNNAARYADDVTTEAVVYRSGLVSQVLEQYDAKRARYAELRSLRALYTPEELGARASKTESKATTSASVAE